MCYVLDFEFVTLIKVCKFSDFSSTFQVINDLFFKEVYNPNTHSVLRNKKSR